MAAPPWLIVSSTYCAFTFAFFTVDEMAGNMPSLPPYDDSILFFSDSDGVSESGGNLKSVKAADWLTPLRLLLTASTAVVVRFKFYRSLPTYADYPIPASTAVVAVVFPPSITSSCW